MKPGVGTAYGVAEAQCNAVAAAVCRCKHLMAELLTFELCRKLGLQCASMRVADLQGVASDIHAAAHACQHSNGSRAVPHAHVLSPACSSHNSSGTPVLPRLQLVHGRHANQSTRAHAGCVGAHKGARPEHVHIQQAAARAPSAASWPPRLTPLFPPRPTPQRRAQHRQGCEQ